MPDEFKHKVSAYILTHNEEKNIENCLESIKWVDEIVIVDSFSTDKTLEIAARYNCKIVRRKMDGFGAQRNAALDNCSNDWIICLDADERLSETLQNEIKQSLSGAVFEAVAYKAPRKSQFLGKWIMHSGWYPDFRHPVFFNKKFCRYKEQLVHESLEVRGKTAYFKGDINHYTYSSIQQFSAKSELYSSLRAREMFAAGKKFSVCNLIFNPVFTVFKMYVLKKGFLDGTHGLILAFLYGYFYTMMKYVKLWELYLSRKT
jgi:glycosyltransferase involved in cell wall biosynthesis